MPNLKSISFKIAVLQGGGGAGRICPPHVCVIQKTPCGVGLNTEVHRNYLEPMSLLNELKENRNEGYKGSR